jgi:O-glycosyl hydrolase
VLTISQWQTTWDRSKLFSSVNPSSPINFVKPGAAALADIIVSNSTKYQTIVGFGGTLSEFNVVFITFPTHDSCLSSSRFICSYVEQFESELQLI